MLKYATAGESHGPGLTAILEGMPAGVAIDAGNINKLLALRQGGYGRGGRMKIEKDTVKITGGVRFSETIGSPIALFIENLDHANWREKMSPDGSRPQSCESLTRPRPGHADLSGGLKYETRDLRNILERSSARETAARVAVGAIAEGLLNQLGISLISRVIRIGSTICDTPQGDLDQQAIWQSPVYCSDTKAEAKMIEEIEQARKLGDSLGGVFEVIAESFPAGVGSHVSADRKLDARLAGALMSIQAIKGVEVGLGFKAAEVTGSQVHDEILPQGPGCRRPTNNAGGIEGGTSNGSAIVVKAAMKPIPTLMRPLRSIDIETGEEVDAARERSDVCAVPAASIVGRAVVAFELARALLEKTGGDSLTEVTRNYQNFCQKQKEYITNNK